MSDILCSACRLETPVGTSLNPWNFPWENVGIFSHIHLVKSPRKEFGDGKQNLEGDLSKTICNIQAEQSDLFLIVQPDRGFLLAQKVRTAAPRCLMPSHGASLWFIKLLPKPNGNKVTTCQVSKTSNTVFLYSLKVKTSSCSDKTGPPAASTLMCLAFNISLLFIGEGSRSVMESLEN